MASPNTLALRARMDALQPTQVFVEADPTPRTANAGDFARGQRLRSLRANLRRGTDLANTNARRDIPTSGPGRRRAKAHRNRGLCLASENGERCCENAEQYGRCPDHLTVEILRAHGALEVADIAEASAWRQAEAQAEAESAA